MTLYKYYLCNEKDEKLIMFKARICSAGIIIYKNEDVTILTDYEHLPKEIQHILNNDTSEYNKVEALEYYLNKWIIPPMHSGQQLDEYIMDKFGFSKKILQNGRLDNLWGIYILLFNHFVEKYGNKGFYITSDKIHCICFSRQLIGADKAFIDMPVTWNDVKGIKEYVSNA